MIVLETDGRASTSCPNRARRRSVSRSLLLPPKPFRSGEWSTGVAWSTIKVPLAIAALRADVAIADQLTRPSHDPTTPPPRKCGRSSGVPQRQLVQSVIAKRVIRSPWSNPGALRAEYTPSVKRDGRWPTRPGSPADCRGCRSIERRRPDAEPQRRPSLGVAAKGFAAKGGWGPGLTASIWSASSRSSPKLSALRSRPKSRRRIRSRGRCRHHACRLDC